MKDYARKFYHSKAWVNTQLAYMVSQYYICERCGNPARIVHHKTYLNPYNIHDPFVTLNWSNLEALCQKCHSKEHEKNPSCANGLRFDARGNIEKII